MENMFEDIPKWQGPPLHMWIPTDPEHPYPESENVHWIDRWMYYYTDEEK